MRLGTAPCQPPYRRNPQARAEIELDGGTSSAKAKRLVGTRIHFDVVSVGATGECLMAAVLAMGSTVIENARHRA